uniref:Reverse transcriptase domain-containing protein n=1 Tax=Tanacetum cinerariifolium TaxID=118510 RepID=A0A6L2JJU4_TANCI|nr:reverse transcriptase domain-containing protein [Tanacetum cinerariifolium]
MHTHASNFEIVEPLPEPERILNRRLRRGNRRVPVDQRNNPPQHPRIVYPPILNINYFRYFLDIPHNYDPIDDEPIWATDRVIAPTPGSAITIPETANEFAIKGNHLTLAKGNQFDSKTKTDPHKHIHEFLRICDMFKYKDTENKVNNSDTNKIIARMDVMTIKMDAQYKELQSRTKQPTPDLDDDDMPMSREKEAKFMQTFYENMLVEVGKFIFHVDFVILEMKEDNKVSLILGRPFLHTADVVIRIKQKQHNLGVGTKRMIFSIDSMMKHSYSNDATCLSINVIDEILEEDFNALLDKGSKILYSIEGTLLEEEIFS